MVERTLVDEIISIIHSEANNNPLPVKCTIHETYPNGLVDVILENGNILTYLPVIGSPRVGDTGVLLYLDDEKSNQIVITNGGSNIDTGWQNVSFLDGYTNSGDNLKIRRIGNIVEIKGIWTVLENKIASLNPVKFATIDEMFRPESNVRVRQQGAGMNTYLLTVDPNGNVYWSRYGTSSSSQLTASYNYLCHALWIVNGGAVGGGGSNGTGGEVDLSNYIQKSSITGLVKNDGSIDSNEYVTSQELPSKTSDLTNDSSFTTLQAVYPVGSIYMSVNNVNPSVLFGFGVWEKIEDKFLLASGTTYENGSTGGSADSVVVSHNHTQNSHTHKAPSNRNFVLIGNGVNWNYSGKIKIRTDGSGTAYYYPHSDKDTDGIWEYAETAEASPTINSTGEDGTNKNMPPYLAVNIWKRTA